MASQYILTFFGFRASKHSGGSTRLTMAKETNSGGYMKINVTYEPRKYKMVFVKMGHGLGYAWRPF